jgi:hypothetical protein
MPTSQWGNGRLILYGGRRGTGKTTVSLREVARDKRAIVVVPALTNPALISYDHIEDGSYEYYNLQNEITAYPKIRVDLVNGKTDLFEVLSKLHGTPESNLTIMLDDLPTLLSGDKKLWDDFERVLLVKLRWQNLKIIGTLHRMTGDIPRKAIVTCDEFYWVGKLSDAREIHALYEISGSDMTEDDFAAHLKSLKNFNYAAPNYEESVFQMMNYQSLAQEKKN